MLACLAKQPEARPQGDALAAQARRWLQLGHPDTIQRLIVDGSLGPSIKVQGRTVEALILPALPVSLALGGLALFGLAAFRRRR